MPSSDIRKVGPIPKSFDEKIMNVWSEMETLLKLAIFDLSNTTARICIWKAWSIRKVKVSGKRNLLFWSPENVGKVIVFNPEKKVGKVGKMTLQASYRQLLVTTPKTLQLSLAKGGLVQSFNTLVLLRNQMQVPWMYNYIRPSEIA